MIERVGHEHCSVAANRHVVQPVKPLVGRGSRLIGRKRVARTRDVKPAGQELDRAFSRHAEQAVAPGEFHAVHPRRGVERHGEGLVYQRGIGLPSHATRRIPDEHSDIGEAGGRQGDCDRTFEKDVHDKLIIIGGSRSRIAGNVSSPGCGSRPH
jgi:hypothetical protein